MTFKAWRSSTRPTVASMRHVDIGTRLFLDGEKFFHFWSLAPAVQGVRRNTLVGTTEFVWLIEDETREVWHALVDKEQCNGRIPFRELSSGTQRFSAGACPHDTVVRVILLSQIAIDCCEDNRIVVDCEDYGLRHTMLRNVQ